MPLDPKKSAKPSFRCNTCSAETAVTWTTWECASQDCARARRYVPSSLRDVLGKVPPHVHGAWLCADCRQLEWLT